LLVRSGGVALAAEAGIETMSDNREASVTADTGGRNVPVPPSPPGSAARDFLERIEHALAAIVTLKVVTLIGPVTVTGAGTQASVAIAGETAPEAASTEIDLLTGHITNTFSTGFAALASGEVRNFHQSQVEKSQSIVTGNLAEVQKLATALLAAVRR
jgi:hypothetical protein